MFFNKENHPQMAELFRWVKYYNLPSESSLISSFFHGQITIFLWFSDDVPVFFVWKNAPQPTSPRRSTSSTFRLQKAPAPRRRPPSQSWELCAATAVRSEHLDVSNGCETALLVWWLVWGDMDYMENIPINYIYIYIYNHEHRGKSSENHRETIGILVNITDTWCLIDDL